MWFWTFSSKRSSMFPFHGFVFRFWVLVLHQRLITYNHPLMDEFWVCIIPGQQGVTSHGSGILHFWRQHSLDPFNTRLRHWQKFTWDGVNSIHWPLTSLFPVRFILSILTISFPNNTWWSFWTLYYGLLCNYTTRMVFIVNVARSSSELS